jgi:hypothetical protein
MVASRKEIVYNVMPFMNLLDLLDSGISAASHDDDLCSFSSVKEWWNSGKAVRLRRDTDGST